MIVIKFVDIFLIVIISGYIGIYKSKKFSNRVYELKSLKSALNIFKSKIEFTYEPIKDIFNEISKIVYQDKDNIFKIFSDDLESQDVTVCWNETVKNFSTNLTLEDKEIISMMGKMLGKTDKNGQISEIELVSNFLNKQIEEAEVMKSKNEKLYKSLGIICGITIAIVFI